MQKSFIVPLLIVFSAGALAQEPMRIKFTLDWVIDGQQTPFFLTQGKGYFTQQGLPRSTVNRRR